MRKLLAIYLRDHHAAGRAGVALARRAARPDLSASAVRELDAVAAEIDEDLHALEDVMAALGVTPSPAKDALASLAERAGRLKLNGHLTRRSPLSGVVELEALGAGIAAKEMLWRSLSIGAHPELEAIDLARLLERAGAQRETVERHRLAAVEAAFSDARERTASPSHGYAAGESGTERS
jgi:hypothetical protein